MNQTELLLLALLRLEQRHEGPRQIAELVVEAWQKDRGVFGLDGYEGLYPHSNRVSACLSARRGPVAKGWIRRPFPGCTLVVLTDRGRAEARRLLRQTERVGA